MFGSQSKVVDLMAYRNETAQPPEFLQMEGYWQALRGPTGELPERSQLDPRGISSLLSSTLLLERIAPGEVRIRLAGMDLHDLMGMELRGMPLSALAVPSSRAELAAKVERVFEGPSIVRLNFRAEAGFARPNFIAKLMLLPMIGATGQIDRALGGLVYEGKPGRAPRRLILENGHCERVQGLPTASYTEAPRAAEAELQGMAEATAPFTAHVDRYPHIRLIKS